MLYDMNFKDTMNCIRSNDRFVDCMLKQKKYRAVFYAKKAKAIEAVAK